MMRAPIAHWPLNGHADDLIGGNDGAWSGTEKYAFNKIGKVVSNFDGTSKVSISSSDLINSLCGVGVARAVAFTVNFTTTANKIIMEKGTNKHFVIQTASGASAGKIVWRVNTSSTNQIGSDNALNDGRDHRVICCYDGATLSMYVDATPQSSTHADTAPAADSDALTIGDRIVPIVGFIGQLRDVMFFNFVPTADEAAQDFAMSLTPSHFWEPALPIPQSAPMFSPVGAWGFDDGLKFVDVSGNGYNLTNTKVVIDAFGRMIFDGSKPAYASAANSTILDFTNTDDFAISFLFYRASAPGTADRPFTKRSSASPFYGYQAYTNTDGKLHFLITGNGGSGDIASNSSLCDGAWHRITFIYLDNVMYMKVDNVLQSATAAMNYAFTNSAKFTLGAYGNGTAPFTGKLAEFCIYPSLTDAQGTKIYRSGVPADRDGELIRTLDGKTDLSAYGRTITRSNCVSLPDRMTFANGGLSCSAITGIQSYGYVYIDPTTGIPSHYATDGVTTWTNGIATGAMPFAVGSTGFSGVTADIVDLWATSGSITAEQVKRKYARTKVIL